MDLTDRVTFIHADGTMSRHRRVRVNPDEPKVIIHSTIPPDWVDVGAEVVAAAADGTVITAFEISRVDDAYGSGAKYPGQHYLVYR